MQRAWNRNAVMLVGLSGALLSAQTAASVWDGVYSTEQATKGEALYRTECASCHGDKLQGKGQAPPLAGGEFVGNWNGMTLADLLEKMQTSMPGDQPGKLSREQNATILGYILNANKFPAGKTDLPDDAEKLKQIRFEAAKGK